MGLMTDVRARRAVRRQLGAKGRIVRRRSDGSPVLEVDGRELVHRRHHGDSYFRVQLLCSVCRRGRVTWRGARITSAEELAAVDPGEVMCDACVEDRVMRHAGSHVVRAKFTYRDPTDR